MLLMLIIPIVLTIAPAMLYQIVLLLGKRKSTSTHYTWTYIMMIYIWLVISVTGIGSIWDIISKGGLMATFQQANVSLIPVLTVVMFHLQIVKVEEAFLIKTFGEEYLEYRKKVCRYIGRKR